MTTRIYSYNQYSESAKALANALGIKRIKHEASKYKPKIGDKIINWGCSSLPPNLINLSIFNDPNYVGLVTNKLSFFNLIEDELTVPYTTSKEQLEQWLADGKIVMARTKLTGHSGEGIVILEGVGSPIAPAPLYTLYMPKKEEYRVHVFRNSDGEAEVFDVQRKARKNDVPDEKVDWRIRNLNGGFIYARQDIAIPACVNDVALKVFSQTGLDFGAVDIIYQDKKDRAFALEINSAPGLAGTTLDKYVEMFKGVLN